MTIKYGQILRSKSQPWLRGMVRRISPRSVTLVTPYGRQCVLRHDLTANQLQAHSAMQHAPPLTFGKEAH